MKSCPLREGRAIPNAHPPRFPWGSPVLLTPMPLDARPGHCAQMVFKFTWRLYTQYQIRNAIPWRDWNNLPNRGAKAPGAGRRQETGTIHFRHPYGAGLRRRPGAARRCEGGGEVGRNDYAVSRAWRGLRRPLRVQGACSLLGSPKGRSPSDRIFKTEPTRRPGRRAGCPG